MERSRREKKSNVDISALNALSAAKRGVESRKDQVRVGLDMGTERRAVDWDIEGHFCIGCRLVKLFDGVSYLGQVVGWAQPSASTHSWLVVYNDGDKEEMEQEELASALQKALDPLLSAECSLGQSALEPKRVAKMQKTLAMRVSEWMSKRDCELKHELARDKKTRKHLTPPVPDENGKVNAEKEEDKQDEEQEKREVGGNETEMATGKAVDTGRTRTDKGQNEDTQKEKRHNLFTTDTVPKLLLPEEKIQDDEVLKQNKGENEDKETEKPEEKPRDEKASSKQHLSVPSRSIFDVLGKSGGKSVTVSSLSPSSSTVGGASASSFFSPKSGGAGGALKGVGSVKNEKRKRDEGPGDVVKRVEEEHAHKVAKLNQIKDKLGHEVAKLNQIKDSLGHALDETCRAKLLNMSVSRRRVASESKNSAPKEFKLDNATLISHHPPHYAPTAYTAEFQRFKIAESSRAALLYDASSAKSSGEGRGRDNVLQAGCDGVEEWMQAVFDRIPTDFGIGLVVGNSATGKSVFLRRFFGESPPVSWRDDDAVISHFDNPEDAERRLMSVGLNAVPTWLKPYKILSNGEKFRATLARQICDNATIDNFSCVTNRNVASSTSTSIARLIRRYTGFRRVVMATSYPDIIQYLSPDWVLFTNSRQLVLNVSPVHGPAITVDWGVTDESAQLVADQLLADHLSDNRNELVSTPVKQDDFTQKVTEDFDFSFEGSVSFKLPALDLQFLPPKFKIGLLVGPSGSGKTTLLRKFGDVVEPVWPTDRALIEHSSFKKLPNRQEAEELLSSCVLTSKEWDRAYASLSDGQKARADAAVLLAGAVAGDEKHVLIDEYTSLLDRRTAADLSISMAAYIAKRNVAGVVLATCHKDVVRLLASSEAMQWVLWTDTSKLYKGKALQKLVAKLGKEEDESSMAHERFPLVPPPQVFCDALRQPLIRLKCSRTKHTLWNIFKAHHYLSDSVHVSARCSLFVWEQRSFDEKRPLRHELVGFVGSLIQPGKFSKDMWRESRAVVHPDYQGLGLGPRISDAVARLFFLQGYRYTSKTSHPRFSAYRDASQEWRCTKKERAFRALLQRYCHQYPEGMTVKNLVQRQRSTSAYEFIGNEQDRAIFKLNADKDVLVRWEISKNSSEAALKVKKGGEGRKGGRKNKSSKKEHMDEEEMEEVGEEEEEEDTLEEEKVELDCNRLVDQSEEGSEDGVEEEMMQVRPLSPPVVAQTDVTASIAALTTPNTQTKNADGSRAGVKGVVPKQNLISTFFTKC